MHICTCIHQPHPSSNSPPRPPPPPQKKQAGGFRPEDARFYAANVLSALEYIHGKGAQPAAVVVGCGAASAANTPNTNNPDPPLWTPTSRLTGVAYRDLKPENLLLSPSGYLKASKRSSAQQAVEIYIPFGTHAPKTAHTSTNPSTPYP